MPQKLAHVLVWGLFLSLVVGACSNAESTRAKSGASTPSAEAPPDERAESPRRRENRNAPSTDVVSRLIQEALKTDGGISHNRLVRQLGAPQRVNTEPVPNQYVRGQIDTLRTFVYSGIRATMYDVANESKTFLIRLSLSTARYTTPEGLRVGLTEQRVLSLLGPPTRRNSSRGELVYQEKTPKSTSMLVQLKGDRVTRIDWEFSFV